MALITPGSVLVKAQEEALSRDERLDTLTLKTVTRGVPSLPVVDSVTGARATLTIEGASTLEVDIFDPEWLIEQSGFLDIDANGRMNAVSVWVDDLEFRLVKAGRQSPDTLTLTFEDIAFALMREHSKHLAASRGKATRAQFIEKLVKEVRFRRLAFFAPERTTRQPVASVDYPSVKPTGGSTGFDTGTKFKIKGQTADGGQMREVATALGVADQEDASPRVRMALLVAGIGESEFRPIANTAGSGYAGVFQADPANIPAKDTAQQARYFLRGGKGFQGGGAIALALAHHDWSAGKIALTVEGSRSNFATDALAEKHYQDHHDEAKAILAVYSGGSTGGASDSVARIKAYQFTRGVPGKKEDSVEAATRLAQEVQWRFWAVGGVVSFRYDDDIIADRATLVIDGINDVGMLEPPTYDWDHGKITSEVGLHVAANRWAVVPGEVVVLKHMGPISGRWICGTVNIDLLDATSCDVTLLKALPKRKEPAPEVLTRTSTTGGEGAPTGSGAADALKWAKSKIGHYKEEFGANRGQELDNLEQGFGMSGAPWCAMFATTAVSHGGVPDQCRTASVATIREWAQAGTHGYTKGFRATGAPGDLACFGTSHVVLVEKVRGDKFDAIQGNGSAGQVDTRTTLNSEVVFVRPNYPT